MTSYASAKKKKIDKSCDSRIERVCNRLDLLNMLTVRVAVLEYSQLHKKAYNLVVYEFGGFCVMRASAPSLYNVYRRYGSIAGILI